jgi:hypothetical protein
LQSHACAAIAINRYKTSDYLCSDAFICLSANAFGVQAKLIERVIMKKTAGF